MSHPISACEIRQLRIVIDTLFLYEIAIPEHGLMPKSGGLRSSRRPHRVAMVEEIAGEAHEGVFLSHSNSYTGGQ